MRSWPLTAEIFPSFIFMKNQTLLDHVSAEQIGCLQKSTYPKTRVRTSQIAEGKGISEATVGLEAQIVVTTRNAQGEQCYEEFETV